MKVCKPDGCGVGLAAGRDVRPLGDGHELADEGVGRHPGDDAAAPAHQDRGAGRGQLASFSKISKISKISVSTFKKKLQNFGGRVLGCTKTKFCKKICV